MSSDRPDSDSARFGPHASRDMAEMFDHVSGRYDLLNSILSLGRDGAWRDAMARAVPPEARVVLDLCTGSGVSLQGLRRPGRLVIGADVSPEMLRLAAEGERRTGWAPRLVCADAFRLPLRGGSLDAVTVAFGVRNLRPVGEALGEIRRALAPGGLLVVLEATAPASGPTAPFHRFYLEHVVPAAGRLSSDPSAYRYLGRSILEFGPGEAFEAALAASGFEVLRRRRFLLGATRLWIARASSGTGRIASKSPARLHSASPETALSRSESARVSEWRIWTGVQATLSLGLLAALVYAGWTMANSGDDLPLQAWQRQAAWTLIGGGALAFGFRAIALLARLRSGPPSP